VTWNFERVATICRERCGGQGYLSCNEFGYNIGFSHAGMTAEGDNSVLMQKVAKELLAAYQAKKVTYPVIDVSSATSWDIKSIDTLLKLVRLREIYLLKELDKNMRTKLGSGKGLFDVWMKEESDLIQAMAKAFGERICLESFLFACANESTISVKAVMSKIAHLFAHTLVSDNLAWFMTVGLVSVETGKHVMPIQHHLIKELLPQAMDIIQGLGVKPWMVFAPIAGNWEKYNESDNRGELIKSRL
jgi:acyl-CoA oxidase